MVSTPVGKARGDEQRKRPWPTNFSPSDASARSTPSKVLATKLKSLDQKWNEHKAQSPIKVTRRNQYRRQHGASPGDHGVHASDNNRMKSNRLITLERNSRGVSDKDGCDESSLGDNSVSTLGSTESVFDRLYRQGTRSSRTKTPSNNQNTVGKTASDGRRESLGSQTTISCQSNRTSNNQNLVGETVPPRRRGSFGSQTNISRHSNGSVRNKKDRLGAYAKSTTRDTKVVGYGKETPRRRTNRNVTQPLSLNPSVPTNRNRHKNVDASSVGSSMSVGSDFEGKSSVFDRLYHNAKRTEKLWKKPKQFKPILSPSPRNTRQDSKTNSCKSRVDVEARIFFPDGENDSKKGKHKECDEPNTPAKTPKEDKATKTNSAARFDVVTTVNGDLEGINQLATQVEDSHNIYRSTVDDKSVAPAHSEQYRLEGTSDVLTRENAASIKIVTSLEEDLEAINEIGVQLANINGGCSPTVAATSISSANWEESSHARRHCNSNEHGFVAGMSTIPSFGTSVDEEIDVLDAVGKQLEEMEADQGNFLCSKTDGANQVIDQHQASFAHNDCFTVVGQNNSLPTNGRANDACFDHLPNNERVRTDKERGTVHPSSDDTVSSTSSASDTSGFFSLKSNRSFTLDSRDFLSKRVDHRACSIQRRAQVNFGDKANRCRSAIVIQKAWRLHRAELELASAMIQSWNSDVQFKHKNNDTKNSSIYRERVFEQAIRSAKCWWILEGLHVEDNWISVAWENEVQVGIDILVQVNLACEAQSLQVTSRRWDPTKLAILLVKATLKAAIRREKSARRVAQWYQHSKGKLHKNATVLQCWIRKFQRRESARKENDNPLTTDKSVYPVNTDEPELHNVSSLQNEDEASLVDLSEKTMNKIPDPTNDAPSIDTYSYDEYVAAVKIQSFLRLAVLRSAVKEWPSAMGQFRAALQTAGSLSNHEMTLKKFDEFKVARKILCNTIIAQHFSGAVIPLTKGETHMNMAVTGHCVSQRAAALAIHNIVRAYLTGLKKFRDKKRASLIQAIFRGYSTRKMLELENLSAVVIQFAWSNCRYLRVRAGSATKIQRLLRMIICKRNYEMTRFCIIYIQAGWRRTIVSRRFVLVRSAVTMIQSTWRRSRDRDAYLKFCSAVRSMQYLFRIQRTITSYLNECEIALMLQSWWRSQSARKFLLRSLDACVCIQSNARTLLECRKFYKIRFDIIMIQRNWRTHICWTRFKSQQRGVLLLQSFCRKQRSFKEANRRRRSIIDIQRVYRGYICKNLLTRTLQNVTKIQKYWRRHQALASYQNAMKAITVLQNFARVLIQMNRFNASCEAVLFIQRMTRGWQCRSRIPFYKERARKALIEKQSNGATALQKIWRGAIERQRYRNLLQSTIIVQKLIRRVQTQSLFTRQLAAVRTIQLWLKGIIAKSRGQKAHLASIVLQCFWRTSAATKHATSIRFNKLSASSTKIQSTWRRAKTRNEYHRTRAAIIFIQSSIRRKLATKCVNAFVQQRLRNNSSVLIQSQWRGAMAREHYAVNRVSAIMIQACTRRLLSSRYTKKAMHQIATDRASILIQAHWRKVKQLERYAIHRNAAITIQAHTRRVFASNVIRKLIGERCSTASILIQRLWRGAKARKSFFRARSSATIVQASVRRMNAKKAERKLEHQYRTQKSVTLIQSTWRRAKCRYQYHEILFSAVIIQAASRRMLALRRTELLRRKIQSSMLIQSHWRGAIARDRYILSRVASTMIQAAVRGMLTRHGQKKIERSAILIQSTWRGEMGRYLYHEALLHLFSSIIIQAATRRTLASIRTKRLRTQIQSAILIQSVWRGAISRNCYGEIRVAATMIQASARGMLTRERFETVLRKKPLDTSEQSSIIRLQSFARGYQPRKQLKSRIKEEEEELAHQKLIEPSTLIQSQWRASRAHREYMQYRRATIMIQSFARGCQLRKHHEKELMYQKLIESSVVIQAQWRASKANNEYKQYRGSAMMIQSFVRGHLLRRELAADRAKQQEELMHRKAAESSILIQSQWRASKAHSEYMQYRGSAMMIQSFVRGHLLRRELAADRAKQQEELMHRKAAESSILIQSQWRASKAHSEYMQYRGSAMMIQSFVRGHLLRRELAADRAKQQEELMHRKAAESSILIQSQWRASKAHSEYMQYRGSAMMIQSFVRGGQLRNRLRLASTVIQLQWRASRARDEYMQYRGSAMMIQSFVRGCQLRNRLRLASTVIQSQWRASRARDEYMQHRGSAMIIQSFVRGYLFRRELAIDKAKQQEEELRCQKIAESSILIQAQWRASKARDKYTRCRGALIMIQAMTRGFLTRSQLESYQSSIIRFKELSRGDIRRKHFYQSHASAIQMQRVWKGNGEARFYQDGIGLSTLIQLRWHGSEARCELAATTIQSMIRGAQVRSEWRFVRMLSRRKRIYNGAARKIQIVYILWRMNIALWEIRSLAVLLKRGIRGQLARSVVQYALTHMNSSRNSLIADSHDRLLMNECEDRRVAGMNAWYRAVSDIKTSAAIVIQSYGRRFITRNLIGKKFGRVFNRKLVYVMPTAKSQSAAIRIQRAFLRWLECRSSSAILIQKTVRLWIAFTKHQTSILRAEKQLKTAAATKIQSIYRYRNQRVQFLLQIRAIIHIQNSWRGLKARKLLAEYREQLKTAATTKIQSIYRYRNQRVKFLLQIRAIIHIQNSWRGLKARKLLAEYREQLKTAAATKIQSIYRYRNQRVQFLLQIRATIHIQNSWRGLKARKLLVEYREQLKTAAATKIQSIYRYRNQRVQFLLQIRAIIHIQNSWRGLKARKLLAEYRAECCLFLETLASTKIQTLQRSRRQRSAFLMQKNVAIQIQNCWRKVLARKIFVQCKTAAYRIQLSYRCYQQRKQYQVMFVSRVVLVQSLVRCKIAQTLALSRRHTLRTQTEQASNKILTETMNAGILIAESLLANRELQSTGPCMRMLADRVQCTQNEAKSASTEVLPIFIHQCDIPLPSSGRKPTSPAQAYLKSTDTGTPVRCNRGNATNEISELNSGYDISKPPLSEASAHPQRSGCEVNSNDSPTTEVTENGASQRGHDKGMNDLAKQASELLREARAAMKKKKSADSTLQKNDETDTLNLEGIRLGKGELLSESHHVRQIDNCTSLEFFEGDSIIPSPIRSEEPKSDWDWTSLW